MVTKKKGMKQKWIGERNVNTGYRNQKGRAHALPELSIARR